MTTARSMYEAVLIELNKENAPNILLEEFNYFANKAVSLYVNKRYNAYDINQLTTDDLRVLKATTMLPVTKVDDYNALSLAKLATYEVILPADYLHILNCICVYDVKKTFKCYNAGDTWRAAATRLTADAYSRVLDNFWNKPDYKRPYYYIHNINVNEVVPTNPYNPTTERGTDLNPQIVIKTHKRLAPNFYSKFINGDNWVYYVDNKYGICPIVEKSFSNGEPIYTGLVYADNDINEKVIPSELYVSYAIFNRNEKIDLDLNANLITLPDTSIELDIYDTILEEVTQSVIEPKTLNDESQTIPSTITINGEKYSNVERSAGIRYGNKSQVRLEIRYGLKSLNLKV